MNIPAQMLELAREDIASAGTAHRGVLAFPATSACRFPAIGFNLAGTLTKPAKQPASCRR